MTEINKPSKITYYLILLDGDVLSYGDVDIDQILTTTQIIETFIDYDLYTKRLREFGIHLNLEINLDNIDIYKKYNNKL